MATEAVLYYWPIKARNVLSLLIAHEGKIALKQTTPDWPAFKPHTVFGQLPHMDFHGIPISQSHAIVRFLSRKAGFEGATDADFAVSEMLIEEYNDLYSNIAKAQYPVGGAAGRPEAMTALFAEGGAAGKHLAAFAKLLGDKPGFTASTTAGELAVVAGIVLLQSLEADVLKGFPTLAAFFAKHEAAATAALAGLGNYFKRTAD